MIFKKGGLKVLGNLFLLLASKSWHLVLPNSSKNNQNMIHIALILLFFSEKLQKQDVLDALELL